MVLPRRSLESGHRRKFLVVVDATPECIKAAHYAARRAEHTEGGLTLLYVIPTASFQQWKGVENLMRAEAMEVAEATLGRFADMVRRWSSVEPEQVIREGEAPQEIARLIAEDEDIAILVLGAGTDREGPGPLITAIVAKSSGGFPVPITVVPGALDDATIAALA